MNKLATAGIAVVAGAGLVAGTQITSSEAASARKAVKVSVKDDFFSPKVATVKRTGTVTWTWRGNAPHDLKGSGGIRESAKRSGTYRKRFNKTGSYRYVCTIHDGMTGTIKVVR